jgi:hypothetical protein
MAALKLSGDRKLNYICLHVNGNFPQWACSTVANSLANSVKFMCSSTKVIEVLLDRHDVCLDGDCILFGCQTSRPWANSPRVEEEGELN